MIHSFSDKSNDFPDDLMDSLPKSGFYLDETLYI